MQLACYEFMSKLDRLYANVSKVGICFKNQLIIYSFPHDHRRQCKPPQLH